jgi:CheY-like chemotaxis protein
MKAARTFLLIDDDTDDRELFTEALAAVNPAVDCDLAMDGEEAFLQLASRRIKEPDVIFLDINLPVMNGWQFLQKLKTYDGLKHIPVIMYSTSSEQSDRETANSLGASCFLTKPHTYGHLKRLLQQIAVAAQQSNPATAICKVIASYRSETW